MRTKLLEGLMLALGLVVVAACGTTEPALVSGVWSISEMVDGSACGEGIYQQQYSLTVMQDGSDLTLMTPVGVFSGKIDGNRLRWQGSYPEDGGIVSIDLDLTINGNSLSGSSTWTWSDGTFNCSGTTSVSGVRNGGSV